MNLPRVRLPEISGFEFKEKEFIIVSGTVDYLFTCHNENGDRFIVARPYHDAEKVIYLICLINVDDLIRLFTNKTTIHGVFNQDTKLVTLTKSSTNIRSLNFNSQDDLKYLPTEGYTLDPDDGEFDEELEILQKEKRNDTCKCKQE